MSARSVAFLVGVDQFSDAAFGPLRFCQNDVDGMARVLRNPEISGFEIIETRNKRHDEILEGLDRTASSLAPGDKLLFYFAGHGRRSTQAGRLYLVATNTKAEVLRATGIPIDSVLDIIRESRCDNSALVLDCCHSGAVGERFRGGDIASGLGDLAGQNAGTYILTASTAIQLAEERESAAGDGTSGNGIFTKYFVEALETGNASSGDSDEITIDAVHDYIQKRLRSQQPQRFVMSGMGGFVIGRSVVGHWERRRPALRTRFLDLRSQNIISARQYAAADEIFDAPWPKLSIDQQSIGRLALDFLDGKLSALELFSYFNATAARLAEEEARRKAEAEAQEVQRADEERRRQQEEAERLAEEERRRKSSANAERQRRERDAASEREAKRRKKEEDETRRAEEERRHPDVEAKRRAEQEQAFAAAKRSDTVGAAEEFVAGFPESHLAGEVRVLLATLVGREEAFKTAIASNTGAALKTFLQAYPKGVRTDEVRRLLRRLEPGSAWLRRISKSPRLVSAALSIVYFASYFLCVIVTLTIMDGAYVSSITTVKPIFVLSSFVYPALIIFNLVLTRFKLNVSTFLAIILKPVQSTLRQISFINKRRPWILFWILLVTMEVFSIVGVGIYEGIGTGDMTESVSFLCGGVVFAVLCASYYWKYVLNPDYG